MVLDRLRGTAAPPKKNRRRFISIHKAQRDWCAPLPGFRPGASTRHVSLSTRVTSEGVLCACTPPCPRASSGRTPPRARFPASGLKAKCWYARAHHDMANRLQGLSGGGILRYAPLIFPKGFKVIDSKAWISETFAASSQEACAASAPCLQ